MFLDLSTLECTHLSDPTEMFVLDLMDTNNNYTSRDVRVKAHTFYISLSQTVGYGFSSNMCQHLQTLDVLKLLKVNKLPLSVNIQCLCRFELCLLD